ncbi:hypothetical protein ACFY0P_50615 [Streptomyces sp. NPDC001714]|uniref:hypothetical protein n=1 Tax=Streptomyces sp. NPDC001714 TaxID=3364603 RepID=UPI0036B18F0E
MLAVLIALGVSLSGVTARMTPACSHGNMAALAFLLRSPSDNGLLAAARGVLGIGIGIGRFSAAMPPGHTLLSTRRMGRHPAPLDLPQAVTPAARCERLRPAQQRVADEPQQQSHSGEH